MLLRKKSVSAMIVNDCTHESIHLTSAHAVAVREVRLFLSSWDTRSARSAAERWHGAAGSSAGACHEARSAASRCAWRAEAHRKAPSCPGRAGRARRFIRWGGKDIDP